MSSLPISAVVATCDRPNALRHSLESLLRQEMAAYEIIFVDASSDDSSRLAIDALASDFDRRGCQVHWKRAVTVGAAAQRNQGVALATQPFVWFFDDDIFLEPFCLSHLWHALEADQGLGGVSAMMSNKSYQPPGFISRSMFRIMAGKSLPSYAGKVLGPAVNLLPEDGPDLPAIVPVEWLSTVCVLYRRAAIPSPPFLSQFQGYSLMEDVCLSVTVGRRWRLANVREARIFHDSQGGAHKEDHADRERMQLVNRHYVMTSVLGRNELGDYLKLALWQAFSLAASAVRGSAAFGAALRGTTRGILQIARGSTPPDSEQKDIS